MHVYTGGAPQGGQGGRPPPQLEHWGGIAPPNFGLQYKGVPKSPLLSLFCNSVYWLKPHNNVNSRPPNLAVLPPPPDIVLVIAVATVYKVIFRTYLARSKCWSKSSML